ncbi:MAG: ATP-dependent DNA helicase RecG [Patescibacteria group bacterium]|nr:ATP-dependent DNA helicase RecG [Patescibacteria group bacterium]
MKLTDPVSKIRFVGKKYQKRLKNLDIETVSDLIHHYPTRYKDFSKISEISSLLAGEPATIKGEILEIKNIFTRRGKKLTKAIVADNSGTLLLVWFNQHYITNTIHQGDTFYFSGKLKNFSGQPAFLSPQYEKADSPAKHLTKDNQNYQSSNLVHTGRLVPIYPETSGVSSKWLRARIKAVFENLEQKPKDPLPKIIKEEYNILNLNKALKFIHFPNNQKEIKRARNRIAFEEMFWFQLQTLRKRRQWQKQKPAARIFLSAKQKEKIAKLIGSLPFKLTNAQKKCIAEIQKDMEKETPMNRLLQGDVGSGKTVVAVIAAYTVALAGKNTAYMAPTEILAKQVYRTFEKYLKPYDIKLSLQTGSSPQTAVRTPHTARRKQQKAEGGSPFADVIIGTHALLHRKEILKNLGLVIIDEQHRFGVKQRAKLLDSNNIKEKTPHSLTMTATPIPRSLALTSYGHLDISTIDELPPGVKPTKTWVVPEHKRSAGYKWIKRQLSTSSNQQSADLKNQAFFICPLIEESEHETLKDVKAVTTEFERLKAIFSEFEVGLLHGQMDSEEKEKTARNFRQGKIQVLVATPVVEVGVDIPQANIMVIEGAHRFGLAGLHQLRGRVGRSGQKSYCLLFTPKKGKTTRKRLKALEEHNSGLELAKIDLKMRGPGELYGAKQHGIPEFDFASLSNLDLIKTTRAAAQKIINEINNYPELKKYLNTKHIAPN